MCLEQSPYNAEGALTLFGEREMCEFSVILNGETVFEDVVYAKVENNDVAVKSVLGESKEYKNCKIAEVDVNSTRLVLAAV